MNWTELVAMLSVAASTFVQVVVVWRLWPYLTKQRAVGLADRQERAAQQDRLSKLMEAVDRDPRAAIAVAVKYARAENPDLDLTDISDIT